MVLMRILLRANLIGFMALPTLCNSLRVFNCLSEVIKRDYNPLQLRMMAV